MLRKLVCSMVVMLVALGFVAAGEYNAMIVKVDGDKVTLQKFKKGADKKPEKDGAEFTLPLAKDAKVLNGTKDGKDYKDGDPIEGGLKGSVFAKIGEKGVGARIYTDGDDKNITKILVVKKKAK